HVTGVQTCALPISSGNCINSEPFSPTIAGPPGWPLGGVPFSQNFTLRSVLVKRFDKVDIALPKFDQDAIKFTFLLIGLDARLFNALTPPLSVMFTFFVTSFPASLVIAPAFLVPSSNFLFVF